MIDSRIARRYVTALYDTAEKAGAVDLVESDLGLVSFTLEGSPDLREALVQPLIPAEQKKQVVEQIFGGKVHEITLNYLRLVLDMGRVEVITATEAEYVRIANERRGILSAEVRAAIELTTDQADRLKARLESYTGKKIDMNTVIDDKLIGGVSVRIGDTVIDGSVAGFLARLKEQMLGEG